MNDVNGPLVHVMKPRMMLAACGVHRSQVFAANVEPDKITCPACRESPEFKALAPLQSEFIVDPPKTKRKNKAFIRYRVEKSSKKEERRI